MDPARIFIERNEVENSQATTRQSSEMLTLLQGFAEMGTPDAGIAERTKCTACETPRMARQRYRRLTPSVALTRPARVVSTRA